jgi:hypothetical protein
MSPGIEAPVAIEQPLFIRSADNGTKPEIFGLFGGRDIGEGHWNWLLVSGYWLLVTETSHQQPVTSN